MPASTGSWSCWNNSAATTAGRHWGFHPAPSLLNVALHGTATHVEKQVQLYRRVKRIEALNKENERHEHRELMWRIDDNYLSTGEDDRSGGDRYLVNIHTDAETLRADGAGAESELEDCCNVPAGTSGRSSEATYETAWKSRQKPQHPGGTARKWTTNWRF